MSKVMYLEQIWTANKDPNGGWVRYEGSDKLVRVSQEEFNKLFNKKK